MILVPPRHSKCVQKKERDGAKKTSPSSEVVKSCLAGRSYNTKSGYVRWAHADCSTECDKLWDLLESTLWDQIKPWRALLSALCHCSSSQLLLQPSWAVTVWRNQNPDLLGVRLALIDVKLHACGGRRFWPQDRSQVKTVNDKYTETGIYSTTRSNFFCVIFPF